MKTRISLPKPTLTRVVGKIVRTRSALLTVVAMLPAMAALLALAGCRDGTQSPGPAKAAAAADAHGHSHGDRHNHGDEHTDEVKLTAEAIERYGVKVEAAQMWALRSTILAPARIDFNAEAMAHVGSPLRGRAVEVKVKLGDQVKVGQELAIIESPELGEVQGDYLQKRTAVVTAGPAVDLTKAAWERAKGLYEQSQGLSLSEVQRREAEHRAAFATLKGAEAAVKAAEQRLHLLGMKPDAIAALASTGELAPRLAIKAAIEGQVVERKITTGEIVGPDREALIVLADTRVLWALAEVPEAKLASIALGARAWITVGSITERGDSAASSKFEGTVSFIAPMVDPASGTIQVRIDLPAAFAGGMTLRPGMFVQAEIVETLPGNAPPAPTVAVPDAAIMTVEGGPAIFVPVANEPNTFAKRAVTVGKSIGGLVPISSGLVEGERFVVSGTFILKAELGKGSAAHEH